jgi:Cu2+-exporting ATPase
MLVMAAVTALVWMAIDPARALPVTFALLAVSCPCALSLATPAALDAAAGALARRARRADPPRGARDARGASITSHSTRRARSPAASWRCAFEAVRPIARRAALAIAARLEAGSEHPLARAIAAAVHDRCMPPTCAIIRVKASEAGSRVAAGGWAGPRSPQRAAAHR